MTNGAAAVPPDSHAGHTAVIYVHGMGEQRRYEEVSRLVDALDAASRTGVRGDGKARSRLTRVRARLEPSRSDPSRDVGYIKAYYVEGGGPPAGAPVFRFYEAYWAPLAAGGRKASTVLFWLLRQLGTPIAVLRSPWRARQRLRRAALHALWGSARRDPATEATRGTFAHLLEAYNAFERPDSRRAFPKGSFGEFLRFLRERNPKREERLERMLALAQRWRRWHVERELLHLFVVASLALAFGLAVAGCVLLVSALAAAASGFVPEGGGGSAALLWAHYGKAVEWARGNAPSVALALLSVLGLGRFLRAYLGDVQAWTTYQETEEAYQKRREILDGTVRLMKHVLSDEGCRRVVVIAHSLGTAIAVDALLELGRYNRARHGAAPMREPLDLAKLDQLVTFGSPIDKIHYFFESAAASQHRYVRVVEEVRGDLGTVPFSDNRKPHVHWVNFWDAGDVISGPVESASNARDAWLRVDNVRVQSLRFPDPAASHSAYLANEDVAGRIFDLVFREAHSLRKNTKMAREALSDAALIGPGTGSALPRVVQGVALSIPWIAAISVAARIAAGPGPLSTASAWLTAFLAGGLVLAWAADRIANRVVGPPGGLRAVATGEFDDEPEA